MTDILYLVKGDEGRHPWLNMMNVHFGRKQQSKAWYGRHCSNLPVVWRTMASALRLAACDKVKCSVTFMDMCQNNLDDVVEQTWVFLWRLMVAE